MEDDAARNHLDLPPETWSRKPVSEVGFGLAQTIIEAFNARLRAECLNENCFLSLADAREKIEDWRRYYNAEVPQGAVGNLAPKTFALKTPAVVR